VDSELLFALPGFLGLPQDWHRLFQQHTSRSRINAIDIFSQLPIVDFWEWAVQFNQMIQQKNSRRILVGYSLGGRLALHVLLQNPSLWHAAVIISAHPGLKNLEERQKRLRLDEEWSQRFANMPWSLLMLEWENQEIFQTDRFQFARLEKDYSRDRLSQAIKTWSLGNQEDLQFRIEELDLPILWMTGARDDRYSLLANQINLKHPQSKVFKIPLAGHRAPWQQPGIFHEQVNQFLKKAI
jgi:2-succinyl-6-hydroxy-2,4-cyclohexadiene-1-carboxylate synthase